MTERGYLRIGELSRRTGVSPELLRAWERRYRLFEPDRSPGRFRLYSDADVARVHAMRERLAEGLSAAQAATAVLSQPPREQPATAGPSAALDAPLGELRASLLGFDEPGANAALDALLASISLETFLREVVLPFLRELGDRWERGEVTVAQEHFASNVLRGRLLALGRGWGRGGGRHALLAAPPGELHDLGLVVFGLVLRDRGWRITLLGADTPIETLADTARRVRPDVVVLSAISPSRFEDQSSAIRALAGEQRVMLGGRGASAELASSLGAEYLPAGPVESGELLERSRASATRSAGAAVP